MRSECEARDLVGPRSQAVKCSEACKEYGRLEERSRDQLLKPIPTAAGSGQARRGTARASSRTRANPQPYLMKRIVNCCKIINLKQDKAKETKQRQVETRYINKILGNNNWES